MSDAAANIMALIARIAPTQRERALLAVLVCVGALAGAIQAGAFAADQAARAMMAAQGKAEAEAAQTALRDPARRAAIAKAAEDARAWSLDDPTFAIAAVRAQTEIEAIARAAAMTDARVEVARARDARAEQPVRLIVEGGYDAARFAAFLAELKAQTQSYGVESIAVDEPAGTIRLVVRAPYQPSAGAS